LLDVDDTVVVTVVRRCCRNYRRFRQTLTSQPLSLSPDVHVNIIVAAPLCVKHSTTLSIRSSASLTAISCLETWQYFGLLANDPSNDEWGRLETWLYQTPGFTRPGRLLRRAPDI
jgi:hypothetical protein